MLRRMVAGLLVLAMLALSGAPVLAAAPADHGRHHAAHDCLPPDGEAAAPPSDPGHPAGDHHGGAPALACCIASQCPMLLGGLPVPPPQPAPPAGPTDRFAAPARGRLGIEIPPALPPPRAA
jgi:hypothetical protein